ncbi:MAG: response regulator [Deltaproteobacteria bacterium]|nr:MAG: response regulator [Deltaproteobacteria bacterium]
MTTQTTSTKAMPVLSSSAPRTLPWLIPGALLLLLLPLSIHSALGGFASSGCVILWAFLSPLFVFLFGGPRKSERWFLAFLGVVAFGGILEIAGVLSTYPSPWWMLLILSVINIACVTGMVYVGTRYLGNLLEEERGAQIELEQQLQQVHQHSSQFLAGMSHELRTPLNAILGFTRIVKRRGKKVLPEKQLDNLDKVLTSASQLLQRLDDIIATSGIELEPDEQKTATERTSFPATPILLVISNDPDVVTQLQDNLNDCGYDVVGAHSREEGILKSRTIRPFAITLDINMPEQSGWKTLHQLKQDPSSRDIPVIMLSVAANPAREKPNGEVEPSLKPMDYKAIQQALKRISNQHEMISHEQVLVVSNTPEEHHKMQSLFAQSTPTSATEETAPSG